MESSTDEYSSSAAGVQRELIHPQQLPPGFRFHPTDEELVVHYLRRKAASAPLPAPIIADVDLYKFDPWELPVKASFGEEEWYFFSPRDRKYPNGFRPNRAATSGYWKATGTDKPVLATAGGGSTTPQKVGVKKALVFYRGKPPKGIKTNWIMHEYRLSDSTSSGSGVDVAAAANSSIKANINNNNNKISSLRLDDWVLCRIYQKNSSSSGNLQRLVHNSELQLGRGKEKDIIGDSTDQLGIMYNYVPPPPLPVLLRHHVGAVPRRPATARVVHDHLQPHNYYYKPPDHTATNCGALGLHLDGDADQNFFGGLLGAAGSSVQLQVNHPSLLMAPHHHHQLAHDDLHSRSSSKPIMPELISMLPAGSVSSVVLNPLKRSSLSSGITWINEAGGAASTPAGKRVQISCSSDDDVSGTVNNDVGEISHNLITNEEYHDNNKNCCGGGGNIIVDEGSRRPCPSMMATLLNMHLQQQGAVVLPHHHQYSTAMLSAIEEGALIPQPYDQLHGRGGINWGS